MWDVKEMCTWTAGFSGEFLWQAQAVAENKIEI